MDAHAAHLSPKVFRAGSKAGFLIHIIPASMTCVLQPLDTHIFSQLKYTLWTKREAKMLASANGKLQTEEYLSVICESITEVFSTSHARAFASCGFQTNQTDVSDRVLDALQWSEVPQAGAGLPSLDDLQRIWPGKGLREIPILEMFHSFLHDPEVPRVRNITKRANMCASDESATVPLHLRLRSSSRLRLQTTARTEPSSVSRAAASSAAAASVEPCPMRRPMSSWMTTASRGPPVGRLLQRHRPHRNPDGAE